MNENYIISFTADDTAPKHKPKPFKHFSGHNTCKSKDATTLYKLLTSTQCKGTSSVLLFCYACDEDNQHQHFTKVKNSVSYSRLSFSENDSGMMAFCYQLAIKFHTAAHLMLMGFIDNGGGVDITHAVLFLAPRVSIWVQN